MVPSLSENEGSARCGAGPPDPILPPALGEGLLPMVGEHPGLVHQPPDLVGTPDTGVVPEIPNPRNQIPKRGGDLCRARAAARSGQLETGRGHARHLVLVVALGV